MPVADHWLGYLFRNFHVLLLAAIKSWKLFFGAGWSLWRAWKYRDRLRRSYSWPMVWGTVHTAAPAQKGRHRVEVVYNYGAQGSYYAGVHNLFFFWHRKGAEFASHLSGQQVEVYYNPENPEKSVMKMPHWSGRGMSAPVGSR